MEGLLNGGSEITRTSIIPKDISDNAFGATYLRLLEICGSEVHIHTDILRKSFCPNYYNTSSSLKLEIQIVHSVIDIILFFLAVLSSSSVQMTNNGQRM